MNNLLDNAALDTFEAITDAATPGPWTAEKPVGLAWGVYAEAGHDNILLDIPRTSNDDRFVAVARTAMPALLREVRRLRALLPVCNGQWLKGSGGHRIYDFQCAKPGIWDVGMGFVCDEHKNKNGGDNDAWSWNRERELLHEIVGEAKESLSERLLINASLLAAERAKLAEATELIAAYKEDQEAFSESRDQLSMKLLEVTKERDEARAQIEQEIRQ